jgi:putative transposase
LRRDGVHKLTTRLAGTYGTVVVEDLNVSGMMANHRLARHIADVGFAEIRRQLSYKTTWRAAGSSPPTGGSHHPRCARPARR